MGLCRQAGLDRPGPQPDGDHARRPAGTGRPLRDAGLAGALAVRQHGRRPGHLARDLSGAGAHPALGPDARCDSSGRRGWEGTVTVSQETRFGPAALRTYLLPDERILWEGQPDVRSFMLRGWWFIVPFSILWGGFAI